MTCEHDRQQNLEGQNENGRKLAMRHFGREVEGIVLASCRSHHANRNRPTQTESYYRMVALIQDMNSERLQRRQAPLRTPSRSIFDRCLMEARGDSEVLVAPARR